MCHPHQRHTRLSRPHSDVDEQGGHLQDVEHNPRTPPKESDVFDLRHGGDREHRGGLGRPPGRSRLTDSVSKTTKPHHLGGVRQARRPKVDGVVAAQTRKDL